MPLVLSERGLPIASSARLVSSLGFEPRRLQVYAGDVWGLHQDEKGPERTETNVSWCAKRDSNPHECSSPGSRPGASTSSAIHTWCPRQELHLHGFSPRASETRMSAVSSLGRILILERHLHGDRLSKKRPPAAGRGSGIFAGMALRLYPQDSPTVSLTERERI